MPDALGRIEEQVRMAAALHVARSRRSRTVRIGLIGVIGVLTAASAASAISGVGPVGLLKGGLEPVGNEPRVSIGREDARGRAWTMRAYRAGPGGYCLQAPLPGEAEQTEVSCAPYEVIARDLRHSGVFTTVATPAADAHLVIGIARSDVAQVSATDSDGHTSQATVSGVWTVAEDDGRREELRAFLAVLDGRSPFVGRPLDLVVVLQDGTEIRSVWPGRDLLAGG